MLHKKHDQGARLSRFFFWFFSALNTVAALWGKLPEWAGGGVVYAFIRDAGQTISGFIVAFSVVGVGASAILYRKYGSQTTWDTLHEFISDLQEAIFSAEGYDDVLDNHKVTIFRGVCSCRLKDGFWARRWFDIRGNKRWLVPVARSHHTRQVTASCFALFDQGEQCTGVAGQAWARKQVVIVSDLPDVSENAKPYKKDLETYCLRAFVSKEWVNEHKPKARSMLAIPLFVRGEPWGVLVFDSRSPQRIRYDDLEEVYDVIQKHLNRLLTKHL